MSSKGAQTCPIFQTSHVIGSVPRYSVLRWSLGEDSDLWFTIRTSPDLPATRTQPCCICRAPGRNYPLGPAKGVLCNECCHGTSFQLRILSAKTSRPGHPYKCLRPLAPWLLLFGRLLIPIILLPEQHLSPCPLCNTGANTIEHWTHYCPVPHMVCNALLRPEQWRHINWMSPHSHHMDIVQALLVHTRRLVRERGALSPGHQTDPMCVSSMSTPSTYSVGIAALFCSRKNMDPTWSQPHALHLSGRLNPGYHSCDPSGVCPTP